MSKVYKFIKPYWPELTIIAGTIWAQFGPAVQSAIAAHPKVDSGLAAVAFILARALPSSVGAAPASK